MDSEIVQEAWDECELEQAENLNATMISPAIFEPKLEEFRFEDRRDDCKLWDSILEMEGVVFMSEPLDGFLRCKAYVPSEVSYISFMSYTNRIKISPANEDCTFEAFEHFISEFEDNVCELEFLGGLEEME